MTDYIIGHGHSHDAGICIVDPATGYPLFAASLERLTRIKNHWAPPAPLLAWADKMLGTGFAGGWEALPLHDDTVFRSENGFHACEFMPRISYRWTSSSATLEFSEHDSISKIAIALSPIRLVMRKMTASIRINGREVDSISNETGLKEFEPATSDEYITSLEIHPSSSFQAPDDTRTLGVSFASALILRANSSNKNDREFGHPRVVHALSRAPNIALFSRLLHRPPHLLLRQLRPPSPSSTLRELAIHASLRPQSLESLDPRPKTGRAGEFDHHLCHAATAYYPSGFADALIVSIDGRGDFLSCRVMKGVGGRLSNLHSRYYEELPTGHNYEVVTTMLGFNPVRHAGKVTGLAAYGRENAECRRALDEFLTDLWRLRGAKRRPSYGWYLLRGSAGYEALRELRRTEFGEFSDADLAYAIQARTEEEICAFISGWRRKFPELRNIALAGGIFANVKLNQRIKALGFDEIFVQPAMSDAGLCFGAALLEAARRNGGTLKPFRLRDVFLGIGFTDEEIAAAIEAAGLEAKFYAEDEIAEVVATLLAEGKVVAHFDGRMEFGPRALGNRSILYKADDPTVNDWLNERLDRTEFMPFAPAVLAEHAHEYFTDISGAEYTAEFMTITCNCTEKAKREIPAAVHVDGTARPQLVARERQPRFHAILEAYKRRTGIPSVINTSFNMHEEPIVATPRDAIRSFQRGRLDALVLGRAIILQDA